MRIFDFFNILVFCQLILNVLGVGKTAIIEAMAIHAERILLREGKMRILLEIRVLLEGKPYKKFNGM